MHTSMPKTPQTAVFYRIYIIEAHVKTTIMENKSITFQPKYYEQLVKEVVHLTLEEEIQLLQDLAEKGEKMDAAISKLSQSTVRLVTAVAKPYWEMGMNWEELIEAGNEGLIKAAERYDKDRGFKFASYAVYWIRQSIKTRIEEEKK